MKGKLIKSNGEWMVKYTTYKTIPGIKGVMGSHSRMPESNHIPLHQDHILYLCPGDNGQTIDFEIVEIIDPVTNGESMYKCAKLINKEKSTKRSKQKKYTNIMSENNIKRFYTEEDMIEAVLFGMQKGLNVGKVDETDCDWVNNYIKSLNK